MIVALFGATIFFRLHFDARKTDLRYALAPPPPHMKYFAFGFNEFIADSLWISYIQDMEKCQAVGQETAKKSACAKGWGFQMLDQITDLAPQFRMPYAVGALSLSVINDDYEGANIIFEKAISAFPNDWPILYRAAYHYLYDRHDNKRAADLLIQASKSGGPYWLPMLAARLYSRDGQIEMGLMTLKTYLDATTDEKQRAAIQKRIAALKCEQDQIHGRTPASKCPEFN
jgi:tetratricopeptide (TPR) repeat protein